MVEPADKFDHKILLKSLKDLKESLPDIHPEPFYNTMLEYVKIFDSMGSGLQMAFKDITGKVGRIKMNYWLLPKMEESPLPIQEGIMNFIKYEQSKKIVILNGQNHELTPEQRYLGYESNFVTNLVSQLEMNRKTKVSEACKKAYDFALAPHHPLAIRMVAKTAMTFAPNRDKLLSSLFPPGTSEEEKYVAIREMMDLVEPTRKFLWDYFEKNDLIKLP